jgi:hypothetical protein
MVQGSGFDVCRLKSIKNLVMKTQAVTTDGVLVVVLFVVLVVVLFVVLVVVVVVVVVFVFADALQHRRGRLGQAE